MAPANHTVMGRPFVVVERLVASKHGNGCVCEDSVHVTDHFVAVVDGVTSKTTRCWEGLTGGQLAGQLIGEALAALPPEVSAIAAVERLTAAIHTAYVSAGNLSEMEHAPGERIRATIALFSAARAEVWLVGDCQVRVGSTAVPRAARIDALLSAARAAYLHLERANGVSIDKLRENDTGREFILPLLKRQTILQNNPAAGPLWFSVLDGFAVPNIGVQIIPVPASANSVVLASDGYPVLAADLAESEALLAQLIASDPLMIGDHASTKGVPLRGVSFDDRAFVRLSLAEPA